MGGGGCFRLCVCVCVSVCSGVCLFFHFETDRTKIPNFAFALYLWVRDFCGGRFFRGEGGCWVGEGVSWAHFSKLGGRGSYFRR